MRFSVFAFSSLYCSSRGRRLAGPECDSASGGHHCGAAAARTEGFAGIALGGCRCGARGEIYRACGGQLLAQRRGYEMSATELRWQLAICNMSYAERHGLAFATTIGECPTGVYEPCNGRHGNLVDASYRAILRNPSWAKRLGKIHAQARSCLPRAERRWRELDTSTSSDALLMNIFCYPGALRRAGVVSLLGVELGVVP